MQSENSQVVFAVRGGVTATTNEDYFWLSCGMMGRCMQRSWTSPWIIPRLISPDIH